MRRRSLKAGALGEAYENDLVRARRHLSVTRLLMKQRRLELAAAEAEQAEIYCSESTTRCCCSICTA